MYFALSTSGSDSCYIRHQLPKSYMSSVHGLYFTPPLACLACLLAHCYAKARVQDANGRPGRVREQSRGDGAFEDESIALKRRDVCPSILRLSAFPRLMLTLVFLKNMNVAKDR